MSEMDISHLTKANSSCMPTLYMARKKKLGSTIGICVDLHGVSASLRVSVMLREVVRNNTYQTTPKPQNQTLTLTLTNPNLTVNAFRYITSHTHYATMDPWIYILAAHVIISSSTYTYGF